MVTVTSTTVWIVLAIWAVVILYALIVNGITNDND
jgi:hypothetical protein